MQNLAFTQKAGRVDVGGLLGWSLRNDVLQTSFQFNWLHHWGSLALRILWLRTYVVVYRKEANEWWG